MKIVTTTLRLPSKAMQYGYAEVVVEHDGDFKALGQWYYGAVKDWQAGEALAKGGAIAVKLDEVLPPPAYEEPVTPEQAERTITEQLGATNITDVLNEDVEEETPEWEAPPPPPSDDDWDF